MAEGIAGKGLQQESPSQKKKNSKHLNLEEEEAEEGGALVELDELFACRSMEPMCKASNPETLDIASVMTSSMSSSQLDDSLQLPIHPPGITLESADACSKLKFEDHYELVEEIAHGSFGTVFVAKHAKTGEEYAVKVIERKKLTDREKNTVVREVTILRDCKDMEHIVRLIDFFASPSHFFVVQVYAQGGDVFTRLAGSTSYNEKNARDLAKSLLEAMQVLHSRKIAHRDLKPENLLLEDLIDDTNILIADFGFATYVPKEGLKTRCGTPAFVAPEVLLHNCRYNERIDMWSVGCLLYMLLGGYPPFQDKNHKSLFRKIRGADFCFHDSTWRNVSISAKQLIASLLVVDPKYRCTAKMALEKSNWFKMSDKALRRHDLSASLGEIKTFNARRQLKSAAFAVICSVKLKLKSTGDINAATVGSSSHSANSSIKSVNNKSDNTVIGSVTSVEERRFADIYELGTEIQESASGVLWECVHKYTREVFAVKIINREIESKRKTANGRCLAEAVLHEAAILDSLDHRYVIKFIDFFEEDDSFYLVTERLYGGDLFDRMLRKKHYTERDARQLARVLLEAVAYLHEKRIAHRDLKPQNLLFARLDDDLDVKIADFGFACRVHTPQSLTTRCGTPTYVAPEILKNCPYDQSADMWSVGVILYLLLCGYPPFLDENQSVLFQKIRVGDYSFDEKYWGSISKSAKQLVRKLMVVNPLQRWTAKQCLESPWLSQDDANIPNADLSESVALMERRKTELRRLPVMWGKLRGDDRPSKEMEAVEMILSRRELNQKDEDDEGGKKKAMPRKGSEMDCANEIIRFTV